MVLGLQDDKLIRLPVPGAIGDIHDKVEKWGKMGGEKWGRC